MSTSPATTIARLLAVVGAAAMAAATPSFTGCTYDYSGLEGAHGSGGTMARGTGGATVGGVGGSLGVTVNTGGTSGSGGRANAGTGGGAVDVGGSGGKGDTGGNDVTGDTTGSGGSSSASGGSVGPAGDEGGRGGLADGRGGTGGEGGRAMGASGGNGGKGGTGGPGVPGGNAGSTGAEALNSDRDLVLWYPCDEATGLVAADWSGAVGGPRNGMLHTEGVGGAVAFSATHRVGTHALSLTANGVAGGGFANIPVLGQLAPQAMTISAWVNIASHAPWQRVFETAANTDLNMSLTTTDTSGLPRFVIRTKFTSNEQWIAGTVKLTTREWHHLVVVLRAGAPYTGQLYVDGVLVGINAAMSLHPGDLGATHANYLGRSIYATDPFLPGLIDDFRVYRRALTMAEITTLFRLR